jgi:hypothetical protein
MRHIQYAYKQYLIASSKPRPFLTAHSQSCILLFLDAIDLHSIRSRRCTSWVQSHMAASSALLLAVLARRVVLFLPDPNAQCLSQRFWSYLTDRTLHEFRSQHQLIDRHSSHRLLWSLEQSEVGENLSSRQTATKQSL